MWRILSSCNAWHSHLILRPPFFCPLPLRPCLQKLNQLSNSQGDAVKQLTEECNRLARERGQLEAAMAGLRVS